MYNDLLKPALAEFFGTFTLVFVGCAAVASGQGVVTAAFAHGLAVLTGIYIYGHISGTHINPAVTLGLLVGGKIKVERAVAYWIAQFLAGIIAALVLSLILGTNQVGPTTGLLTAGSVWGAAVFEFVITFFLVTAVYQCAVYGKAGDFAGIAIGLTLAIGIFAAGTYTGGSMNPARTLGPAIVTGDLSYVIPYLIGIFGGGAVAGLVHTTLFAGDAK